jgi:phosphoribosylformylglycinamidine synthase
MWTLLEAARGCHDAALAHRTPFVSGKDSFNNEYWAKDGSRASIPPSLLISAIGIVPDVGTVPGTDLKAAGNPLFLAGDFRPVFGGSVYGELFGPPEGSPDGDAVPAAASLAHEVYVAVHKAILAGCVASCHDLSEGGLAVAVAEMCLGGRLGARLEPDSPDRLASAFFFGETNGCLVIEARGERKEELLKTMDGLPFMPIGETADSGILELAAGSGVARVRIDDIVAAFRQVPR